jgi:hypothetical protein
LGNIAWQTKYISVWILLLNIWTNLVILWQVVWLEIRWAEAGILQVEQVVIQLVAAIYSLRKRHALHPIGIPQSHAMRQVLAFYYPRHIAF